MPYRYRERKRTVKKMSKDFLVSIPPLSLMDEIHFTLDFSYLII